MVSALKSSSISLNEKLSDSNNLSKLSSKLDTTVEKVDNLNSKTSNVTQKISFGWKFKIACVLAVLITTILVYGGVIKLFSKKGRRIFPSGTAAKPLEPVADAEDVVIMADMQAEEEDDLSWCDEIDYYHVACENRGMESQNDEVDEEPAAEEEAEEEEEPAAEEESSSHQPVAEERPVSNPVADQEVSQESSSVPSPPATPTKEQEEEKQRAELAARVKLQKMQAKQARQARLKKSREEAQKPKAAQSSPEL